MTLLGLSGVLLLLATQAIDDEPPPVPETPAAVADLVLARPFRLAKGFQSGWSQERRMVSSGTLVVLEVDPAFVYPRDSAEPVLYAGSQPIQRLNRGDESGHVIGIIPGNVDLDNTPIWFGAPDLPERVNAQKARAEWAAAERAGIRPFAEEKLSDVTEDPLQAEDLATLLREHVAELVLRYSPQEKELAETWRLPVAQALPKPR